MPNDQQSSIASRKLIVDSEDTLNPTSSRPNIIFIFSDQHRHDAFGCAGNSDIQTPNIDRLAATGVRFEHTWCQSPICQPSRASLITSKLPSELGILRNFGPDMDCNWPTFMRNLQSVGYTTANIGKTHYYAKGLVEPDKPTNMADYAEKVAAFGFDHVVEEFDRYVHAMPGVSTPYTEFLRQHGVLETYQEKIKSIWRLTEQHWDGVTSPLDKSQDLTSFLTCEAQKWLQNQNAEKPFFLQLSYVQPHVPLMGDPEWSAYYKDLNIPRGPSSNTQQHPPIWAKYLRWCGKHANAHLLSDTYVEQAARQYYAMISLIDECIGGIVHQLQAQNLLDNTIIVYSSDHGEMLGDHGLMAKFNFYQSSVQIPLIIRPAGGCSGQTLSDLAELADVGPTLLDYAGAEALTNSHGRSLRKNIEHFSSATPTSTASIQSGKSQGDMYTPFGKDAIFSEIQMQSRKPQAPTFHAVRDKQYRLTFESTTETLCELFDLDQDPLEQQNLANESSYPSQRKALMEHLRLGEK